MQQSDQISLTLARNADSTRTSYNNFSQTPDPLILHEKLGDLVRMSLSSRVSHHRTCSDQGWQTIYDEGSCSASSKSSCEDEEYDASVSNLSDSGSDTGSCKDEEYDTSSVSDTGSDTGKTNRRSEQEHNEKEMLANREIMTNVNQVFGNFAANIKKVVQKYDNVVMDDDVRAEIKAFMENLERLHEMVRKMRSRLEEDIEKLRRKDLEMDVWSGSENTFTDMVDGHMYRGVGRVDEEEEFGYEVEESEYSMLS